jgi:hypothetical protein
MQIELAKRDLFCYIVFNELSFFTSSNVYLTVKYWKPCLTDVT